jgi:HTH-type transcriptional regulator/antitoxin HipB
MEQPNFPAVIRRHRKRAKLTQKELAELAGVGKTVVFDVEAGKRTVQLNIVLAILDALNIRVNLESPLMHSEDGRSDAQS